MFTTIAFAEQFATAAAQNIAGVTDQTHKVSGDDIYIGKWNQLVGAYAAGYSLGSIYLVSPSLRRFSEIYIEPFNYPGGGGNLLRHFCNRINCPVSLDTNEALNCYFDPSGVEPAGREMMGVWLADAPIVPVFGPIHTIRCYSTTATAFSGGEWKSHELTMSPDLAVGRYAIVGARFYGGRIGLFRFVFREQSNRPGGILLTDINLCDDEVFRLGKMGVWGEYDIVNPPSLDILVKTDIAATQFWGYLDIMKIA